MKKRRSQTILTVAVLFLLLYSGCAGTKLKLHEWTKLPKEHYTIPPYARDLAQYKIEVFSPWGNLLWASSQLIEGSPAEGWDGTYDGKDMITGVYIWTISARFKDNTFWKGSDNGDGNRQTRGTVTLIR